MRYVSLNPVRVGLVRGIEELDVFPYTGHAVVMGRREFEAQDVDTVLGRFGSKAGPARRRYREFVAQGLGEGRREEFRGGGLVRSAGGWDALRRRKRQERELGDERVLGGGEFVEALLGEEEGARRGLVKTAEEVLAEVSRAHEVGADEILGPSRERRVTQARGEFYLRAHREAGQTLADLGRMTGRTQPAVWQAVERLRAGRRGQEP